jgi:DNA-binding NtrC family response regulator
MLRCSPKAAEALLLADFPRNVRELRNIVDALRVFAKDGRTVHFSDLAEHVPGVVQRLRDRDGASVPPPDAKPLPARRRENVQELLVRHQGNVAAVAREIGKPRAQVYRWLESLGIDVMAFRPKE